VAIAKGLLPLAQQILALEIPDDQLAARIAQHVDSENGLARPEDVIDGVKHIIAETVADDPEVRTPLADLLLYSRLTGQMLLGLFVGR
jgi:uncharacterized protein